MLFNVVENASIEGKELLRCSKTGRCTGMCKYRGEMVEFQVWLK